MRLSLIMVLIHSDFGFGLQNKLCEKEQLELHVNQNLECFIEHKNPPQETIFSSPNSSDKQLIKVDKRNDARSTCSWQQELFIKKSICFLLPLQNCFDEKWTILAYEFFSSPLKKCSDSSLDETFISTLPERSKNAALALVQRMQDHITIDAYKQPCSHHEASLLVQKMLSCFYENLDKLTPFLETFTPSRSENNFPSICGIMKNTLNTCFKPNVCYSELQMASLRETMLKIYIIHVEGLLESFKVLQNFQNTMRNSSRRNFLNNMELDINPDEDGEEKDLKEYIAAISVSMEEYRMGNCEVKITGTIAVGSPLNYFYQKWFTIPLIAVSLIITCYLLVQCTKATQT